MSELDPKVELHMNKKHEEIRKENAKLFSAKWVEKAFTTMMYLVGIAIVGALLLNIGINI